MNNNKFNESGFNTANESEPSTSVDLMTPKRPSVSDHRYKFQKIIWLQNSGNHDNDNNDNDNDYAQDLESNMDILLRFISGNSYKTGRRHQHFVRGLFAKHPQLFRVDNKTKFGKTPGSIFTITPVWKNMETMLLHCGQMSLNQHINSILKY